MTLQGDGAQQQHADVHRTGEHQCEGDIQPLDPQQAADRPGQFAVRTVPVDRQRRMQVDGVWHHRRAEHGGDQRPGLVRRDRGHQPGEGRRPVGRTEDQGTDEAEGDHQQERPDAGLEHAFAAPPKEPQQQDRDPADDDAACPQGQAEQQVQAKGAADHLSEVGGDRDHERLQAVGKGQRLRVAAAGEPVGHGLRQRPAGDESELRGLVLDDHRHQGRRCQHPHERVTVGGAGAQVGCDVARVDIGDACHERGSEHGHRAGGHRAGAVGSCATCVPDGWQATRPGSPFRVWSGRMAPASVPAGAL